jgi:ribonuclease D
VTRSEWEAPSLSKRQVLYAAAQDALVCGGIFRQLVLEEE